MENYHLVSRLWKVGDSFVFQSNKFKVNRYKYLTFNQFFFEGKSETNNSMEWPWDMEATAQFVKTWNEIRRNSVWFQKILMS